MAVRQITDREAFLLLTPDDTEDAPWMVMDDAQVRAVDVFKAILFWHLRQRELLWYLGSYLKITAPRPGSRRPLDVAPDLLVAKVPDRPRSSWRVPVEGKAPEFVLEVASPSSLERDTEDKPELYDWLGVEEYAIFLPERPPLGAQLSGYRRDEAGRFVPWRTAAGGMLWSGVLELGLYVEDGRWLRVQDPEGRRLPTPWEVAEAEAAARQAEVAARQEADRRAAEAVAEAERLREELRRLREGGG